MNQEEKRSRVIGESGGQEDHLELEPLMRWDGFGHLS